MRVLAGDIGGTKTIIQVADIFPASYKVLYEKKYASNDYNDFMVLVKEFVKEAASEVDMILSSACFGVAGPVRNGCSKITNLPWTIEESVLSKALGIPHVLLVNDFQAVGYGLAALQDDDVVVLQEGEEEVQGPRIILGAGTGLGEGVMYWHEGHYEILPSEGGHVDFAPTDADQLELYRYLKNKLNRVSYEDVVSGTGLKNIFSFLRSTDPASVSQQMEIALQEEDHAAVISHYALQDKDALAVKALDMFCRIYGAQAGNLALTALATGGVYIAGGIAAKNIDVIKQGGFIRAFNNKGPMSVLLNNMPVKVVMNPKVGLMGAAMVATRVKN